MKKLNPLFASFPPEINTFLGPSATQLCMPKLCVPVAKNNMFPPP